MLAYIKNKYYQYDFSRVTFRDYLSMFKRAKMDYEKKVAISKAGHAKFGSKENILKALSDLER